MEPKDILWRILEQLDNQASLLAECYSQFDPKKYAEIRAALAECEQLTNTQKNIINRIRRRHS